MSADALSREEALSQFCALTGVDEEKAKALLEASNWNVDSAISMHAANTATTSIKSEPNQNKAPHAL